MAAALAGAGGFSTTMNTPLLHRAPLLLPAVGMAVGIVVGAHGAPMAGLWWPLVAMVAAACLLRRWPWAQVLAVGAAFVALGMAVSKPQKPMLPLGETVDCVVAGEPAVKPKTVAIELLHPATGVRQTVYLPQDERSLQLRLGDDVRLCLQDERFVRPHQWQRGGRASRQLSRSQRLRLWFLQQRHGLLERYKALPAGEDELGVLAAMTLGDRSWLSAPVRQTYAQTGAAHVLALSGLHLGIIYVLLTRLMLGRRRLWAGQVAVVLGLWAFAWLSGLSASVVRSATMISLYALFSLGGRTRAPLNVLCFTAMVMLLVDARALWDVGFQLSFAAMFAILLSMPFFALLMPQGRGLWRRALRGVLSLMAVAMAAQLGVAPLLAYYFGQFSTYFMLSSLVVVPVATLILHVALAMLLWPPLGAVLVALVGVLNGVLTAMAQWPGACIGGLHPSAAQVAMVYVAELGVVLALWQAVPRDRLSISELEMYEA